MSAHALGAHCAVTLQLDHKSARHVRITDGWRAIAIDVPQADGLARTRALEPGEQQIRLFNFGRGGGVIGQAQRFSRVVARKRDAGRDAQWTPAVLRLPSQRCRGAMLVLCDSETKELIAKFVDEKIARFTGAALSKEIHRPLTLAITEAARVPIACFRNGVETHYTAPIEVFAVAA